MPAIQIGRQDACGTWRVAGVDECRVLVLFVCTGNAGRSQIAEELFRRVAPAGVAATSAGVDPWEHVHPMAARVLAERDIDISRKTPRHVRERIDETFGLVVTIGDPARDEAPDFAGHPVRLHWDIGDPADADGTPDSESVFRHVLSAISDRLDGLLDVVGNSVPNVAPFSAGISTCVVRRARFEPASHLPLIARAGFGCIELNCHQGEDDFDWKSRRAIRELASVSADLGVPIRSVHAPGTYPRTHPDEAVAREYVDTTKAFCDIAAELGARLLVVHALKVVEDGPPGRDEPWRLLLDELAAYVLPLPVVLGYENLTCRVDPAEDLAAVRSHSRSAMGFVLDNGHAHLFGASDAYLASCGRLLCGLHIQDNDATRDGHWLPGEGTVDWKGFMSRLVETGYTGPLMLEVQDYERQDDLPKYLDDAMASVRMLRLYLPKEHRDDSPGR